MVIGASMQAMEIPPLALISARRSIAGWPSGTASDSEDTMEFSVLSNIRPLIETFPLERATEAYERMISGKARFRVVLTTEG
jgi:D-arabinose 1-dehydrogenase-like Zn-dependent alcohol dehydrogenase